MKSGTATSALPVVLLFHGLAAAPAAVTNSTTVVNLPSAGLSVHSDVVTAWGGGVVDQTRNLAQNAAVTQTAGGMIFGSRLGNLHDGRLVSEVAADEGRYSLENTANSAVPSAGSEVVFALDGARDIGKIEVFTAYQWTRAGQKYDIYTSTNGGASWSELTSVDYANGNLHPGSGWMARRVTVERPLAALAAQVNAVKIVFPGNDPVEGAYPESVYNEIAIHSAAPVVQVEEPPGTNLPGNAAARTFGPVLTGAASAGRLYTVRNTGSAPLPGLAVAKSGAHAGDFTVTPPAAGSLAPGAGTTFTVSFAPTAGGARSAQLSVAGSDTGTPPWVVNLSGFGLGEEVDTDGDGMSDAGEAALSALGFDWQSSQPGLVAALRDNAHRADLFDRGQFDAERAAGRAEVTGNPAAHGLYDSNSIMELRLGGAMVPKEGDAAAVVFQLQATGDLTTQPFTNRGPPATRMVPMPSGKAFLRINAAHPRRRRRLYAGARRAKLGRKEDKI